MSPVYPTYKNKFKPELFRKIKNYFKRSKGATFWKKKEDVGNVVQDIKLQYFLS